MGNIYDLPVDERKSVFLKLLDEIPKEDNCDERVQRRLEILKQLRTETKE